jgi:hypothetical protein
LRRTNRKFKIRDSEDRHLLANKDTGVEEEEEQEANRENVKGKRTRLTTSGVTVVLSPSTASNVPSFLDFVMEPEEEGKATNGGDESENNLVDFQLVKELVYQEI